MANDNTAQNGTAIVAADNVNYSGDDAVVQLVQLAFVTGSEGAHSLNKAPGDATNGFVANVSTGAGAGATVGTTAGAAVTTDATGTLQQYLRGLVTQLGAVTASPVANTLLDRLKTLATLLAGGLPAALGTGGGLKSESTSWSATCTVTNGQTVSAAIDTSGARNMGLLVPSTFNGTTITFQVSDATNGTFGDLYDINNVQVSMTIAVSRAYDLPGELMAWKAIKIVCGSTQTSEDTVFIFCYRS